jgi:hypothetical protein
MKRFVLLAVFFCAAVLVFTLLSRQCGLSAAKPEAPEETLKPEWNRRTPVMNDGGIRNLEVNDEAVSFILPGEEGDYAPLEEIETVVGEIIVPYTKRYLNIGQETEITVRLENGETGDGAQFRFTAEAGKNSIGVNWKNNTVAVKALREGVQYIRVSHPLARDSRIITFDVLPPAPPPPPSIELSESPLLVAKGETKPLTMTVMNGKPGDNQKFSFKVAENAYAVEAKQQGDILNVTGIAPGAALIRISNSAVSRDYELMVVVDSYGFN